MPSIDLASAPLVRAKSADAFAADSSGLDPWNVAELDFPEDGSPREVLEFCLRYAILAPSGHNTQPWRFRIAGNSVYLYADRTRALPIADPDDRELTISCGAAAANLQIALRYFGYSGEIEEFPSTQEPDLVARVRLGEPVYPSSLERNLFHAIPKRRTNRTQFEARQVSPWLVSAMQAACEYRGAWLEHVDSESMRGAVIELVAQGDRLQMADRAFRRELALWVRPASSPTHDGIPLYAQGVPDEHLDLVSGLIARLLRRFDTGGMRAAQDRELAHGSPVLAVLGTHADRPWDWFSLGQVMERVLLLARDAGVWASFLNQPVEVPALRARLRELLGRSGYPQIVLRMGYGAEVKPTPRRALRDVVATNDA
jgi:hypothetical protein